MISLINAQRKLTDTEQRMIDDGDFFDVTSAQIRALCAKLFQMGYPLKEVQRIRTKYWDYFTDKEKEVMQELGLNYDEQAISKRGDTLLINGFTVRQWKMLTADDYFQRKEHGIHSPSLWRSGGKAVFRWSHRQ